MHPLETAAGVPAFLAKLWRLVEDKETNDLISWSSDGRSFIIQNQASFAKDLLPLNYKHNNMASFIRQLNMYGFHKITSIDNGGLKFDKDEMEFSHPYFQQGHPYLLEHIKRKIATTKQIENEKQAAKGGDSTFSRVLTEVKNMNRRQDTLDNRFSNMKQENEALWREIAILRQKHLKQQQIVNKLIQFLVTIVQPTRSGLGSRIGKRRGQLMINDAPQSKMRRNNAGPIISELTEELLGDADSDLEDVLVNADGSIMSPESFSGETSSSKLDEELIANEVDEIDTTNMAVYSGNSKRTRSASSTVGSSGYSGDKSQKPLVQEQPLDVSSSGQIYAGESLLNSVKSPEPPLDVDQMLNVYNDPGQSVGTSSMPERVIDKMASQAAHEAYDNIPEGSMSITKYNPNSNHDIMQLNSVNEYSSHLDNVQNDLDSLKDLLRNDNYCFDSASLVDLFDGTDLVGFEMSPSNMDLFSGDDKKDAGQAAEAPTSSYQANSSSELDINDLLNNVCEDSKITN